MLNSQKRRKGLQHTHTQLLFSSLQNTCFNGDELLILLVCSDTWWLIRSIRANKIKWNKSSSDGLIVLREKVNFVLIWKMHFIYLIFLITLIKFIWIFSLHDLLSFPNNLFLCDELLCAHSLNMGLTSVYFHLKAFHVLDMLFIKSLCCCHFLHTSVKRL